MTTPHDTPQDIPATSLPADVRYWPLPEHSDDEQIPVVAHYRTGSVLDPMAYWMASLYLERSCPNVCTRNQKLGTMLSQQIALADVCRLAALPTPRGRDAWETLEWELRASRYSCSGCAYLAEQLASYIYPNGRNDL